MTKIYIVVGKGKKDNFGRESDEYVQPFGSVTEVCKFLKKIYDFPEKDSRSLIITAFGKNTKLWIQVGKEKSVRISQHKVDAEVRLHGNAD
tara:strand:- start:118 stop:390 length:273 start_codon:yes stop_codon:yes gene_type:complete